MDQTWRRKAQLQPDSCRGSPGEVLLGFPSPGSAPLPLTRGSAQGPQTPMGGDTGSQHVPSPPHQWAWAGLGSQLRVRPGEPLAPDLGTHLSSFYPAVTGRGEGEKESRSEPPEPVSQPEASHLHSVQPHLWCSASQCPHLPRSCGHGTCSSPPHLLPSQLSAAGLHPHGSERT